MSSLGSLFGMIDSEFTYTKDIAEILKINEETIEDENLLEAENDDIKQKIVNSKIESSIKEKLKKGVFSYWSKTFQNQKFEDKNVAKNEQYIAVLITNPEIEKTNVTDAVFG